MKKRILYSLFYFCAFTHTAEQTQQKITPKHSNIFVQKITNDSDKAAFICLEKVRSIPLDDTIDISGAVMAGNSFDLRDPADQPSSASIPVWQKTFKGNHFNIITLSGNPGRIYFLYSIQGHLWAIVTPEKKGELKGIHLLNPSKIERRVEIKLLNNNVIEVVELDRELSEKSSDAGCTNKKALCISAVRQRCTAPQIFRKRCSSNRCKRPLNKSKHLNSPRACC